MSKDKKILIVGASYPLSAAHIKQPHDGVVLVGSGTLPSIDRKYYDPIPTLFPYPDDGISLDDTVYFGSLPKRRGSKRQPQCTGQKSITKKAKRLKRMQKQSRKKNRK